MSNLTKKLELTSFHKVWYKYYITIGHPALIHFNYLPSAMPTWWICEILMWDPLTSELAY